MSSFPLPKLKDTAVFLCWITGLISAAGLCWFLTKPLRAEILQNSINHAWTLSGESRRLESAIGPETLKPELLRLGDWYSLGDGNQALVFTLMGEGVFLPCAAIVSPVGKVEEIMPLAVGGKKTLERVSPGLMRLFIRRIEGNYE